MNCEWREKTGLYVDGELELAAQDSFTAHLESCAGCAAAVLEQQELKKAVRIAGKRFTAPPELYASVQKSLHPEKSRIRWWNWALACSTLVLLIALGFALLARPKQDPMLAELVGQHLTTLASANPVDIISSNRHTVGPWFAGKLPFAFHLPELEGSPYTLIGGKVAYIQQSPGAQLLYQVGQHKITVFIFQAGGAEPGTARGKTTFSVKGWRQGTLQFYMVTDASDSESGRLVTMLQEANR